MLKRVITLSFFILGAIFLKVASVTFPNIYLYKLYQSFVALTIIYCVFRILFQEFAIRGIKDARTKYSVRKAVGVLFYAILIVFILRLWVVYPQNLLVAYGLVAAGVAVSLQDVFKNFAGSVLIFANGLYSVGDRIEVGENLGDVIDIGMFYTTLMELKHWVDGDQATGRLCVIPNGLAMTGAVHNYTKDHSFIWDEIKIPITYDSDWKTASKKILAVVRKEIQQVLPQARKELSKIEEKYFLSKKELEPAIFFVLTDNWITFNIRYPVLARERRPVHTKISELLLSEIQKSKNIKIASTTLDIIGFPGRKAKTR